MTKKIIIMIVFISVLIVSAEANVWFEGRHNSDKWDAAGDATLNQDNIKQLVGKAGDSVRINGEEGNRPSLVTKRRDYRDVEVQIFDSYRVEKPTAGHCGGVYPRAESKPTYHHIDKGSPPRVNAVKPAGQWQTMDIIFQAARFDKADKKTAYARFVKVVHNGKVIQEDVEVPYACGTNWNRKQYPKGPIIIQGDYGPIAVRNVRIREWKVDKEKRLNVPPEGFTALFNGKDFTCCRRSVACSESTTLKASISTVPLSRRCLEGVTTRSPDTSRFSGSCRYQDPPWRSKTTTIRWLDIVITSSRRTRKK